MTDSILVVDDEPMVRKSLAQAVARGGVDVLTAGDAREALAMLDDSPCPMVFTDLRMPGMDGLTLLRSIKQRTPSTQVVIVTAFASDAIVAEARRAGASEILNKPFTYSEIRRTLEALLGAAAADESESSRAAPKSEPVRSGGAEVVRLRPRTGERLAASAPREGPPSGVHPAVPEARAGREATPEFERARVPTPSTRPASNATIPVVKPPILASQCLQEDLAPRQPARRPMREAAVLAGLAGGIGVLLLEGTSLSTVLVAGLFFASAVVRD